MQVTAIGKIIAINPIEKADRLESATVVCGKAGKWQGVVEKGVHHVGELVEVYLQDAQLPEDNERFAFMAQRHYRVKIATFRGAPSECLIMPLSIRGDLSDTKIGDDIAFLMRVTKYEKPLPASIGGDIMGHFPQFIPRTDELNWQAYEPLPTLAGREYIATVKMDGASSTAYLHDGHFGVCSRNYELKDTPGNTLWQIARRYNLEETLRKWREVDDIDYAVQWETCGPGIQSNPVGLTKIDGYAFSVYNITLGKYCSQRTVALAPMPKVAVIGRGWLPSTMWPDGDWLRELSRGQYPNGKPREGVVLRDPNGPGEFSFKVINPDYKG